MIVDQLTHAAVYDGLGVRIQAALAYLRNTNFDTVDVGRHDIDGDTVYAIVMDYHTKPPEQGFLEVHRRYLDVQYIVTGTERMGYAHRDALTPEGVYDEDKDLLKLVGDASFLAVTAGTFLIFYPHDAHMPGIALNDAEPVRKVVVKVRADLP